MSRPRLLTDVELRQLVRAVEARRVRASVATLAAEFEVSPRTMSRYLQQSRLRSTKCPRCHGLGVVRAKEGQS
jgi:predicted DNA-binding transcriptional regulator YafY